MASSTAGLPDARTLGDIVIPIARSGLLERSDQPDFRYKSDRSLLTEADRLVQQRLQTALAEHWPAIAFLGEEMPAEQQQRLLERDDSLLWCLDPLDGTRNFAYGVPFFAVSLALLAGGEPILGLVYDPLRDECFTACRGAGARLNDLPLPPPTAAPALENSVALVDFKRLAPALAGRIAASHPFGSQRSFGAVALDWCWLACGRAHVYLHGGQKLWDYAAGHLILHECGGHSITLDGEPVFSADLAPRSVAAALDGGLFASWTRWLGIPGC
ncbi:MAG: inositol monophosphatase family protein [Gammaproteobacteria bacterium]